ncbi:DUF317 domain-containing protein [Streptomyces sp. NPDC058308]|uniref:DUF317 domain-containing protein n=1 Tax=Streptomyces sp. NPDC058308 TaxID=3346440 RepID=UPI0036F18FB6
MSRDELRGAEWILASYPFELGGSPVARQLSACPHAGSAMTERNACFTGGVPHEVLADLLVAIDAREAPDVGFEGPKRALTALRAQGRLRGADWPGTTATDPASAAPCSGSSPSGLIVGSERPKPCPWSPWKSTAAPSAQLRPRNDEGSDR